MKVVHSLPGRLRLEIAALRHRAELGRRLEALLPLKRGIGSVQANTGTGRLLVYYAPDQITPADVGRKISDILSLPQAAVKQIRKARPAPLTEKGEAYELEKLPLRSQFALTTAATVLLITNQMSSAKRDKEGTPAVRHILNSDTALTVLTGIPLFRTALEHLLKKKQISTELLAGTASLASLFLEEHNFGLFVLWLVYLNTLIRSASLEAIRDRIRVILEGKKPIARLKTEEGTVIIPAERLTKGSLVEVRAGERLPADGIVTRGKAAVNQLPIEGRRCPRTVTDGQEVFAGSILTRGRLIVKASAVGEETRIGGVIAGLREEVDYPDPAAMSMLNGLSLLAAGSAGLYYLFTKNAKGALNILIVGLPGAAGLARAIPAETAAVQAGRLGALVKNGKHLARLGRADLLLVEDGLPLENRAELQRLGYTIPEPAVPRSCTKPQAEAIVRRIRAWQKRGHTIAMLGTDRGDAPPLSAVDVGITTATGQDLHLKSAAIVLVEPQRWALAELAQLARTSRRIAAQNTGLAVGSAVMGISLGLAGLLTPFWAGLIQNFNTLAILANSLRLTQPKWAATAASKETKAPAPVGLTAAQARRRRSIYGPNLLPMNSKPSPWQIFVAQLNNYMSKVLLGLSGLSLLAGKPGNALLGSGVLLANTALAVLQENRTQKSMATFTAFIPPAARVIRGGKPLALPTPELVPGDLLLLMAGDKVPADVGLVESKGLIVEEATLTGEAGPVFKEAGSMGNMGKLFMGTKVLAGTARATVVRTGPSTQMGTIVQQVGAKNYYASSPVYRRLDEVGAGLARCGVGVTVLALLSGLMHGKAAGESLVNATGLAVSVIPDGLMPMITLTLALGSIRLAKRGIMVRHMPAVDTLGCIDTLCWDKTGTLTENRMEAVEFFVPGQKTIFHSKDTRAPLTPALTNLLRTAVLCSSAQVRQDERGKWQIKGDSTEGALLIAAHRLGVTEDFASYERVSEIPFSAKSRQMTVNCVKGKERWTFVKGAPEAVLQRCYWLKDAGGAKQLLAAERTKLEGVVTAMSKKGLRVLGFAYRVYPLQTEDAEDEKLIFAGLIGISDPPRPEAQQTIIACRSAGIEPVMITGDHQDTALAVAEQVGVIAPWAGPLERRVLTGSQLEKMSHSQLMTALPHTKVYARMSPLHKLRLVKALKSRGRIVAMIGDGVNDAPAIRAAHVGITLGKNGAGATREIAPVVLPKNDLTAFPKAIEGGRTAYENIRKSLRYSLTTNLGDGVEILWSTLLGKGISIEPQQLFWVNMISDPPVSWLLANDPPQPDLMSRAPRRPEESIFAHGLGPRIICNSLITGISSILVGRWSQRRGDAPATSRTLSMLTAALSRMWQLTGARRADSRYKGKLAPSPGLTYVGAAMLLPVWAAIYVPGLQPIFRTKPLQAAHWRAAALGTTAGFLTDKALSALIAPGPPQSN